jgi:hypothetical protein
MEISTGLRLRLDAMRAKLDAIRTRNRELQSELVATRHTEHCKRSYVVDVLYPEATAAVADEPYDDENASDLDARQLARAAIAARSAGGSTTSAVRATRDLQRANQLAVLNPLVDQLRRMSDAYEAQTGRTIPASNLAAVSVLHEASRRGL